MVWAQSGSLAAAIYHCGYSASGSPVRLGAVHQTDIHGGMQTWLFSLHQWIQSATWSKVGDRRDKASIMSTYEPIAIANALLVIAGKNGETLSPMKLQKLVYFSHGWHLGLGHGPLSNEEAEAWQWGPVFPSLYHAVKRWGSGSIYGPITKTVLGQRVPGRRRSRETIEPSIPSGDQFTMNLLERIWEVYGEMTALQLSALSHVDGGPWDLAPNGRGSLISNQSIADFFSAKVATNG